MEDKAIKFYFLFFAVVVALTYFTYTWLVGIFGSIAFLVPGCVAVACFWLAKKLTRPPS